MGGGGSKASGGGGSQRIVIAEVGKVVKVLAAKKKKARLVDYLTAVLLNILAVIPVLFSAPYLQEKVIFLILMHRSILNPLNLIYCKNMEVLLL